MRVFDSEYMIILTVLVSGQVSLLNHATTFVALTISFALLIPNICRICTAYVWYIIFKLPKVNDILLFTGIVQYWLNVRVKKCYYRST